MKLNWKSGLIASASAFVLFLAIQYWPNITSFAGILAASASTLIIGACLAYVVNILMRLLERKIAPNCTHPLWKKARRPACMGLAFLILMVAIVLLFQLIVPQLVDCFDNLVKALGKAVPQAYAWLDEQFAISQYLQEQNLLTDIAGIDWRNLLEKYAKVLLSGFGGVMNVAVTVTTSLFSLIVTAFLSIIFACNILAGKEKIGAQFYLLVERLLGKKNLQSVRHVLQTMDDCFHSYIVGQLTEALILGALCTLGMLLFRMDYAPMIGTLIGVTALIPVAGAYIGAGLGAIMLFSVSPGQALGFLVFILVLQQIEGNIIYPRTVGNSLHLPGIWVLAAVTIGGGVMGIPGMLLFVPLTATVYRLLGEWASHDDKPSLAERITTFGSDEASTAFPAQTVVNIDNAARPAVTEQPRMNSKTNRQRKRR